MTLLIPEGMGACSVRITHVGLARAAAVTFGVDFGLGLAPDVVAKSINDTFTLAWKAVMDADTQLGPTTCRLNYGGGEPITAVSPDPPVAGTLATSALPPNCAVLVHKRTSRGGRRGRGRLYLPWSINEASCDELGVMSGTAFTNLQTAANSWRTAMTTNGHPLVVLHQDTGTTAPGAPDEVDSLFVDSLISTQRRRLGR